MKFAKKTVALLASKAIVFACIHNQEKLGLGMLLDIPAEQLSEAFDRTADGLLAEANV